MTNELQPKTKNTTLPLIIIVALACIGLYFFVGRNTNNETSELPKQITSMYVCGYSRCTNSGDYGELVFTEGINVWNNHDPDRGGVHHQVKHGDRVGVESSTVIDSRRWYKLIDGGWINDLWLTDKQCTPDNLDQLSMDDC